MRENIESWFLFQIWDGILDRWSPVYCAASQMAAIMECKELQKKLPGRPFKAYPVGYIEGGKLRGTFSGLLPFHVYDVDLEEVKHEVSATE